MATSRRDASQVTTGARSHQSPRRRPPAAVRGLFGLAGLVAVAFTGALMLSDRAPSVLRVTFGDRTRRLWERIDAGGRTDVITARPETDFVVHVAIWSAVAVLVALAIWTWWGLLATAVGAFGLSVMIELAQGRWSSTRQVELRDVAANALGISAGAAGAALVYLAWSAIAGALAALSRR